MPPGSPCSPRCVAKPGSSITQPPLRALLCGVIQKEKVPLRGQSLMLSRGNHPSTTRPLGACMRLQGPLVHQGRCMSKRACSHHTRRYSTGT